MHSSGKAAESNEKSSSALREDNSAIEPDAYDLNEARLPGQRGTGGAGIFRKAFGYL